MNYMKEFLISFSGLSLGKHEYEFEIKDKFFESLEYSELKKGSVHVDMTLEKHSVMLVLNFSFKGEVTVMCDRCADDFEIPVEGENKLIIKFGPEPGEESEDIIVIGEGEHEIDVSQFIYEYIILALPLQRVHGDDAEGVSLCDPEVLKKLAEISVKHETGTDPRWDALKGLQ
jgi:uncharacterized metal-binding protein YceD (DUF177 family)